MQNSIIKNRVAYFSMGSRTQDECFTYAARRFPWYKVILVDLSLRLVGVFSSEDDSNVFIHRLGL